MSNNNIEAVRRINADLVKADGSLKTFQEQLLEYKYGKYPKGVPLVVSETSKVLNLPTGVLDDLPITINQAIISKIEKKHGIEVDTIIELNKKICSSVLGVESLTLKNGMVLILNEKNANDDYIVCALHKNVKSVHVEVNAIRSLYGKEKLFNLIKTAIKETKDIYTTNKTDDWIKSIGVYFPKEISNHLSLIKHTKEIEKCQGKPKVKNNMKAR
ncbi:MAG: hypothetical protein ACK5LL_05750 [Suipraeoptans sp.]